MPPPPSRIPIPVYDVSKSYELFEQEIDLWELVTDVAVAKRAGAIALLLPDDEKSSNLKFAFLERCSKEDLTNSDGSGLTLLKATLKNLLGREEIEDSVIKWDGFEDFKRTNESITDFISAFDLAYTKCKNRGITLSEEVLMFKIIRQANIPKTTRQLVLSGIDYTSKTDLYEQARKSLKKFGADIGSTKSKTGFEELNSQSDVMFTNSRGRGNRFSQAGFRGQQTSQRYPQASRGRGRDNPHQGNHSRPFSRGGAAPPRFRGAGEKPMNQLGADGKPLLCSSCGSYRHYVESCWHSWENMKKNQVNFTDELSGLQNMSLGGDENNDRFDETDGYEDDFSPYEDDTFPAYNIDFDALTCSIAAEDTSCGLLDTCCASTVSGLSWFNQFAEQEGITEKDISRVPTNGHYKFGKGGPCKSLGSITLPITFGGRTTLLKTDIVDADIPLLISLTDMGRMGMIVNTMNDTIEVDGTSIPVARTRGGKFLKIPLTSSTDIIPVLACVEASKEDLEKTIMKLHRQFGHPSFNRMKLLLKDGGVWEESSQAALDAVYQDCRSNGLCKFKRVTRPVVAMNRARDFNEILTIDLKKWDKCWILHMIDMYSRYTVSVFISRKRPTDVIHAIMSDWISVFGVMGKIHYDNGGEFANEELLQVQSMLNIEPSSTSSESPYQNGICERNHEVVDLILTKLVMEFPQTPTKVLLKWASTSKNSLQMVEGFSPHQLVFGRNPHLPNLMNATPTSIEVETISECFNKHLAGLHAARRAFIESESSEKIKRALRHKIRTNETNFEPGDKVYYLRDKCDRWLGPAKVIFQDGKVIFVRHGAFWIKVSPNRLCKAGDREFLPAGQINNPVQQEEESGNENAPNETAEGMTGEPDKSTVTIKYPDEHVELPAQNMLRSDFRPQRELSNTQRINGSVDQNVSPSENNSGNSVTLNESKSQVPAQTFDNPVPRAQVQTSEKPVPRALARLQNYNQPGKLETESADTSGRSLRSKSDTTKVQLALYDDNPVYLALIPKSRHGEKECVDAKQVELEKLKEFAVYDEVENMGQECISTTWVLWHKGDVVRARLVARGFEETDLTTGVDSPTIGKSAVRLVLCVAQSQKWTIKTTDIKSAFLQGQELKRVVYIKPPKEADTSSIWKLKRCLYGLNDAARQFYMSLREELLKLGLQISSLDPSLFYLSKQGKLCGMLVSHIDDFLHCGDEDFNRLIDKLCERFLAGNRQESVFKYVGYEIRQTHEEIYLSQEKYICNITSPEIKAERKREKSASLSKEELSSYRSLVGSINWVVQSTRPDLFYELIDLSTRFHSCTVADLIRAQKLLIKLKAEPSYVCFPDLGDITEWTIVVYTDASHANVDQVFSCGGAVTFISNGVRCAPICWRSGKIHRVVRSTLAAEGLALCDGIADAIYMQAILSEIFHFSVPIVGVIDQQGLFQNLHSTKLVDDKRLRLDLASLKEDLSKQVIQDIKLCSSRDQLADALTKRGASGLKLLSVLQTGRFPDFQ